MRAAVATAILTVCVQLVPSPAHAATPAGAVTVGPSDVFKTTENGSTFTCARVGGRWIPGAYVSGNRSMFLGYKFDLRNTKTALRTATGTRRTKLTTKVTRLNDLIRRGGPICSDGPGDGAPRPTPAPTSIPQGSGNFDAAGNVTDVGKILFGIPSNFSANINTGKSLFQGTCYQCHTSSTEPMNRRFSQIKFASQNAPMFIIKPDSELAHITAYLNRYRR